MTKHTTRIVWLLPFMAMVPVGLAHCSGDDTVAPGGGKKADASTGLGSDGSGGQVGDDSGSGVDGGSGGPTGDGAPGPTGDGGGTDAPSGPAPIPVPEGGAPSDPGSVVCNGAPCAVNMGYSCCAVQTDAGQKETCNPPNTGCSGLKIECNEATDCNGGVCCQAINGIAVAGSRTCSAAAACAGGASFQACRTDGECGMESDAGDLKRCVPQLCTNANPMRTLAIEACAVPPTISNGYSDAGTLGYCAPVN